MAQIQTMEDQDSSSAVSTNRLSTCWMNGALPDAGWRLTASSLPISSLLRASTARFLRAPDAALTTLSCSLVKRSAMAERAFSWRRAERMYRPYYKQHVERSKTDYKRRQMSTPSPPLPDSALHKVLTVQRPAHKFWMAPADASRMAGFLLSLRSDMYIRTTSGWNNSS